MENKNKRKSRIPLTVKSVNDSGSGNAVTESHGFIKMKGGKR